MNHPEENIQQSGIDIIIIFLRLKVLNDTRITSWHLERSITAQSGSLSFKSRVGREMENERV
jgi:hypothetical protein